MEFTPLTVVGGVNASGKSNLKDNWGGEVDLKYNCISHRRQYQSKIIIKYHDVFKELNY
jgi:hypothetical protein